jgi:peptidase E
MTPTRRILGISDSKSVFVTASEHPQILQLIRDLTNKAKAAAPSICYIGAAKGDRPERTSAFFDLAKQVGFHPTSLDMYAMETSDPRAYFPNTDAIFIDGGVTRNLIALLREWEVVDALVETYRRGTLIAGASAGISMLFDWCISDSIKSSIQPVRGIGLLKGSVCAHYDALEARRSALATLVQSEPGALPAIGIEDGVAALFENETLATTYTIRPEAKLHVFEQA